MDISLQKGQKIDLTKTNPGLKKILIGLGWDINKYDGGGDFDLDAAKRRALALNPDIRIFPVSAKTGEGMAEWEDWLLSELEAWKRDA